MNLGLEELASLIMYQTETPDSKTISQWNRLENCCGCDYIKVYDGPSVGSRLLGTVCNNSLDSFYSSSNYLTVLFRTDGSVVGRGFSADYTSILPATSGRRLDFFWTLYETRSILNVFFCGRSSEVFIWQHEDWDSKELPGLSGLLCRQPVSGRPKLQTLGHQISSHLQFPHQRLWQRSKGKKKLSVNFPVSVASKRLQTVISLYQLGWKWQGGVHQHSPSLRLQQRRDLAPVQPEAQCHLSNGAGLFITHHVPRP